MIYYEMYRLTEKVLVELICLILHMPISECLLDFKKILFVFELETREIYIKGIIIIYACNIR